MNTVSFRLKVFVVVFVIFVIAGAGIRLRSSLLAQSNVDECTSKSSVEDKASAITTESMLGRPAENSCN